MTFVSPLITIALFLLIGFLTNVYKNKERVIDIVDESGYAKAFFSNSKSSTKYKILKNTSLVKARTEVEEQEHYGLLYIPKVDSISQLEKKHKILFPRHTFFNPYCRIRV
jgi:ABC-2 type transport system permease protein